MSDSFRGRVKKTLEAPKPPSHHLQYRSVIPLRVRIWRAIRLPSAVPGSRKGMNQGQRRLVFSSLAIVMILSVSWGVFSYISAAEERSTAAVRDGQTLVASGKMEAAIERFSAAISDWPENAPAFVERGNAYLRTRNIEAAKADWNSALKLDPTLPSAYIARGTQHRVEGNLQKALEDLDHALRLASSLEAHYQRGQTLSSLGDFAKAIESFDLAIAAMPDAPYVYRARSAARRANGDMEGSQLDVGKANSLEHR